MAGAAAAPEVDEVVGDVEMGVMVLTETEVALQGMTRGLEGGVSSVSVGRAVEVVAGLLSAIKGKVTGVET